MKRLICLLLLWGSLFIFHSQAFALVNSVDLIEKSQQYNQELISFEGEVIGDLMPRGKYVWVNVSDGNNALGVWVNGSELRLVRNYGSYKTKGDIIRIEGTFHRSCVEHGGDMDIHAHSINILKKGEPYRHQIKTNRILLAVLFLIAGGVFYLVRLMRRKREAKG